MTTRREMSVDEHVAGVKARDRMTLGRTISLVESNLPDHRERAQQVLARLLDDTGGSLRVGITGVPGVGKSTFIETLGLLLIDEGLSVAVLAVDPTSSVRGGSILGDKTRMGSLSVSDKAFIRPSPTQGSLGGVHRKTRETMLLCEAAGFDVVLVETVGVGQSETEVADMVDTYVVLMLAGAGDELQGIKKGILEVADILAINKADGDNKTRAEMARREYKSALHIFGKHEDFWQVPVLTCSAQTGEGVAEVWQAVLAHREALEQEGELELRRQRQRLKWMWSLVHDELLAKLKENEQVSSLAPELEQKVLDGQIPPTAAAFEIVEAFLSRTGSA